MEFTCNEPYLPTITYSYLISNPRVKATIQNQNRKSLQIHLAFFNIFT